MVRYAPMSLQFLTHLYRHSRRDDSYRRIRAMIGPHPFLPAFLAALGGGQRLLEGLFGLHAVEGKAIEPKPRLRAQYYDTLVHYLLIKPDSPSRLPKWPKPLPTDKHDPNPRSCNMSAMLICAQHERTPLSPTLTHQQLTQHEPRHIFKT